MQTTSETLKKSSVQRQNQDLYREVLRCLLEAVQKEQLGWAV